MPSNAASALWRPTGSLTSPRAEQLSVLLRDGRVLVAGGNTDRSPAGADTAELFDPVTASWTRTGDLLGRRNGGAELFLLLDGRALVVGGSTPEPVSTVMEAYDPRTGFWTSASALEHVPWQSVAVRLADGRILVAGGTWVDSSAGYLASAELYDPSTHGWSATASMPRACADCRGIVMADGRVLVIGGFTESGYTIALRYDPLSGRWSPTKTPALPDPVRALVLLRDGRALAIHELSGVELYDPVAGSWTSTASRGLGGVLCTATVLTDGRVLVTIGDAWTPRASWAELFDPARGSWSSAGTMTMHRIGHSATLLADGRILVAGGSDGNQVTASAEIFDPARLR